MAAIILRATSGSGSRNQRLADASFGKIDALDRAYQDAGLAGDSSILFLPTLHDPALSMSLAHSARAMAQ